jgi:hypothetical protein
MEFYKYANVDIDVDKLQQIVTIRNLTQLCDSIYDIIKDDTTKGKIYCIWGYFKINKEIIKNGVRFTLPNCPNALAWTITKERVGESDKILIHCTINRSEHEPEFIQSIDQFVSDWKIGLEGYYSKDI